MPQVVLAINTILGEDKDRLLVAQDSEGLRKLQDPNYTVSTVSEQKVASVLSQMDGGSIALAGSRGAGKSTLLRKFSGPLRIRINGQPCISLYLTAPAEYVPRDFIAELLQRLCETYLAYMGLPLPQPIYRERMKLSLRALVRHLVAFMWLFLRTAILVFIIIRIAQSFRLTHYNDMYLATVDTFRHWYHQADHYAYQQIDTHHLRSYWTILRVGILSIVVLFLLAALAQWKEYMRPDREPELAQRAREYLLRLQVDKTVTWGTTLKAPPIRGLGLSTSRGGSASYTPWTLPELVGYTRRFMHDIAEKFQNSSHAIVIGIDEIDRIGSLDHAERFIGEIKAVFGVEKCFFLVAVAEDVGSVFAQRATVGRSMLENAFDDIIVVEPLKLEETRDLLLKRVPGFTDSFVYLVHALSGGLPRELIRITRRLVDVNQEFSSSRPLLESLTFVLIQEQLVEAIRATRSQMSRLTLHANWTAFFETLLVASTILQPASAFPAIAVYDIVQKLSELMAPEFLPGTFDRRAMIARDEDRAKRLVTDLAAFSYFGMTVIDAFSDKFFDFQFVQQTTAGGSAGSYEQLAVARTELAVSAENSRAIVGRFRDSLLSHEPG